MAEETDQLIEHIESKLELVEDDSDSENSLMDDDFHDAVENLDNKSKEPVFPGKLHENTLTESNIRTDNNDQKNAGSNTDQADTLTNNKTAHDSQPAVSEPSVLSSNSDIESSDKNNKIDDIVSEALNDEGSESEEEDEDGMKELKQLEETLSEQEKEERKDQAQEYKAKGNELFKDSQITEAKEEYTKALKLCPLCYKKERSIMYSNRAACQMKLENNDNAISDCSKAIELNPRYTKCVLRRAELYDKTEKLDEALKDFEKVVELEPSHQAARMACMQLPERIKERNEKMKEEMLGKLKDLGNMILKPFGLSTNNFNLQQDPNTGGYSVAFNNNGK